MKVIIIAWDSHNFYIFHFRSMIFVNLMHLYILIFNMAHVCSLDISRS
jgi:hypothetical protein